MKYLLLVAVILLLFGTKNAAGIRAVVRPVASRV